MGYWGIGTFENDCALDWAADLARSWGSSFLRETLEVKPTHSPELAAYEADEALAAAEVIAALRGRPAPDLPKEIKKWVAAKRELNPGPLALQAVAMIDWVLSDTSELNQLRSADPERHAAWRAQVLELRSRLVAQ